MFCLEPEGLEMFLTGRKNLSQMKIYDESVSAEDVSERFS